MTLAGKPKDTTTIRFKETRMSHSAPPLYVHDVIDQRPLGRIQLGAIAMCILIAVLDGFDAQIIGMLAPAIAKQLAIPVSSFTPVFVAGQVGMLIGAVLLAPLADKYGRKLIIVASTLIFGGLTMATAFATTIDQLALLRLLTGVGLGGALPNAIALAAEYSPKRHARTTVATLMCGMPLGAVLGGLSSSVLLPIYGWQSLFILGGVLPLIVALFAMMMLPESARYLAAKAGAGQRLTNLMRRIAPDLDQGQRYAAVSQNASKVLLRELFTDGRARGTILLWIPYFMNLVVIYFIVSWLPSVLTAAGHLPTSGIAALSSFSVGGVIGCLIQGPLMNRYGARKVLLIQLVSYAMFAAILAQYTQNLAVTVALCMMIGVAVNAAQAGFNVMASEIYPTHMRATGIGCAVGAGRVGSICGPVAGGTLLAAGWDASSIFLAGVIPALIAATAVALNRQHAD